MKYEIERLKNDLEVIFIDLPGSTAASAQIWFRAGSTFEDNSNLGIAHFLEHMFFKGTQTRPGAMIAHEVESFGGEVNAFTSFDYTCYYINTPNSKITTTLDILLDMVANPMFLESELIPEREVVFEEYRRSIDSPNQYSFQKLQKACFTGGYAHPILGSEKTIKSFSREQLLSFRESYYNSSNSFLVVAGDLSQKDSIVKEIEKYKLPKGSSAKRPAFKLKSKPTIEIHNKDVRMCQLTLTIQSPSMTDENSAAEDLAYNALGHGESSPLYKKLVLDGSLANQCASSTMFFSDGGIHFLRINFPVENYSKVMKKFSDTINDIIKNGILTKDITKIKNQYIASKIYAKESIESFSFSLGSGYAQSGDINSEDIFIDRIKNVNEVDVNNAFSTIFSRPLHLSLQIPSKEKISTFKPLLEKFSSSIKVPKSKIDKTAKSTKTKVSTNNVKSIKSKYDSCAQIITLKEGINLIYRHNPMTPTFVIHAYSKGGLTEETNLNNGIYNLTSGLLTKGYKGLSYAKLKLDLEDKSASLSHFSGKNAYGLTMHGQTQHYRELMTHFFSSFLSPSFETRAYDHERKIILRSLEAQKEDASRQCFNLVGEKLFNGHSYARSIIGTQESIKKLKKKSCHDLHSKNINSKELLFTYCGDLKLDQVLEIINPFIKSLKPRKSKKYSIAKIKKNKSENLHITFDREQTQIFIGAQTSGNSSKENIALKMLTTHLSGQSSELFVDVRDRKGLCYVAQPVNMNALEAGYWGIYMASGHDKVPAAIDAIKSIIKRLGENGLSKEEFERVKLMIEGQNETNLQVNDDYANVYSIPALQGQGMDYYYKNNEEISKLDHTNFNKILKDYFKRDFITVTVGRN